MYHFLKMFFKHLYSFSSADEQKEKFSCYLGQILSTVSLLTIKYTFITQDQCLHIDLSV